VTIKPSKYGAIKIYRIFKKSKSQTPINTKIFNLSFMADENPLSFQPAGKP